MFLQVNDDEVKNEWKFNLEEKLLSFSVLKVEIAESVPQTLDGH